MIPENEYVDFNDKTPYEITLLIVGAGVISYNALKCLWKTAKYCCGCAEYNYRVHAENPRITQLEITNRNLEEENNRLFLLLNTYRPNVINKSQEERKGRICLEVEEDEKEQKDTVQHKKKNNIAMNDIHIEIKIENKTINNIENKINLDFLNGFPTVTSQIINTSFQNRDDNIPPYKKHGNTTIHHSLLISKHAESNKSF
jgi:hypothetical protein